MSGVGSLTSTAFKKSRRLERTVPPENAVSDGASNRLGDRKVEIVDDGLDRLAHGCARILLLQSPPSNPEDFRILIERLRVILEAQAANADA